MSASGRGKWLGLLIAVLMYMPVAKVLASEAVVTTYDDRTLTGELVSQDENTVTLLISGIKTPIPRQSIKSIEIKDAPPEQYRKLRAELDDDDLDGRYRLAYQMYEKKWYELAMVELQSMRRDFPDSDKVRALQTVVQSRIDREREEARQTIRPSTGPGASNPTTQPDVEVNGMPGPERRLTEEQINTIRVYEVDLSEEPNISLKPETIEKLYENYSSNDRLTKDRREFRRMPGHEQLEVLFDLQARELYPEVIIRQDSPAIKAFRTKLHQRYVLSYCAATGCHGDGSPGNLFLFRTQPNSDPTVYTNFYILNQIKQPQGVMIDRDEPGRSLLLQYGLDRDAAAAPHPDVKGWRPQFVDDQDPRYRDYMDAIDLLWKPAPDYGIDYTPPVLRSSAGVEESENTQPTQ